jgi:hypothetical protein
MLQQVGDGEREARDNVFCVKKSNHGMQLTIGMIID